MDFEVWFSIAGVVAMLGWLLLLGSPFIPAWSDRIAGWLLPTVLSIGYIMLLILPASGGSGGGFGTLGSGNFEGDPSAHSTSSHNLNNNGIPSGLLCLDQSTRSATPCSPLNSSIKW